MATPTPEFMRSDKGQDLIEFLADSDKSGRAFLRTAADSRAFADDVLAGKGSTGGGVLNARSTPMSFSQRISRLLPFRDTTVLYEDGPTVYYWIAPRWWDRTIGLWLLRRRQRRTRRQMDARRLTRKAIRVRAGWMSEIRIGTYTFEVTGIAMRNDPSIVSHELGKWMDGFIRDRTVVLDMIRRSCEDTLRYEVSYDSYYWTGRGKPVFRWKIRL